MPLDHRQGQPPGSIEASAAAHHRAAEVRAAFHPENRMTWSTA
jgi:hypothetical protein